ncbi:MAG: hypothetical protein K2Y37_22690 [Pirellulales bacterium]|nr:hypothetical protein [Pirellulales bacterium]
MIRLPFVCQSIALSAAAATIALFASCSLAAAADKFMFNHLEGEVVAVEPGKITWTDKSNVPHIAYVTKETKVQVTGEIEPAAIVPGAFARFTVPVTKRLAPVKGAEVEEVTLFLPGDGYQVGMFPDNAIDPKQISVPCLVAGQVKTLKKGLLTVTAGNKPFKIKLADKVKVRVDFSDYSVARKGDNIVLTGSGLNQREIECKGVEINLAAPLASDAVNKPAAGDKKPRRGAKVSG